MRIVFSKDRAAQLDLLLRSIERHMPPEETTVIWRATTEDFLRGYKMLRLRESFEESDWFDFNFLLRDALNDVAGGTVTFFCDDDIVYRPVPKPPAELLADKVLTVCLYLGRGTAKMALPNGFPLWDWTTLERHDFGFPTAVDGNTYRVEDVLTLIVGEPIPNPTMLETTMSLSAPGIAVKRPLMASFEQQCLVGVPVNRVSDLSGVHFGLTQPQTAVDLNRRFLAGEQINLDALDFSGVNSCHHEIRFEWEPR